MVIVWWSAAHLIHYSFLNPSETIHLRNMLSTSVGGTENCDICSQHWSTEGAQSLTMPRCTQPILQKLNELGYEVLPHLLYASYLRPTDYYFFKHLNNFLQGKCFHNQQEAENAFQEFFEAWIFTRQE